MELKESIENRRSIRNFKETDVTHEIIEDILNCGRFAPSAKNRQPWYFVVLKNKIKDQVADLMINYTKNNDEREEDKRIKAPSSVESTAYVIKQAPVLVCIFKEKDSIWTEGDNLSIGGCVENMCLRAVDLGLGTLWIRDTVYVSEEVAKMLNHDNLELNCTLAIGYANETPKQAPRKKLNKIMEWCE